MICTHASHILLTMSSLKANTKAAWQQIPITECWPVWGYSEHRTIYYLQFSKQPNKSPARSVIMSSFYRWRSWVSDTLIHMAMAPLVPGDSRNPVLFTSKGCYLCIAPTDSSFISVSPDPSRALHVTEGAPKMCLDLWILYRQTHLCSYYPPVSSVVPASLCPGKVHLTPIISTQSAHDCVYPFFQIHIQQLLSSYNEHLN